MLRIASLLFFLGFVLPTSYGRIWTDTQGRTIDADFVSVTKYKVKVRRASDAQYFEILLSTLSDQDRQFALSKLEASHYQKDKEAFERRRDAPGLQQPESPRAQPIVLGHGQSANRLLIPSLSGEELGHGYPSGPSCIVNFLVWWGDTIALKSMPHTNREQAIRKIAGDLEDYFGDDSNSVSEIWRGIDKYSEKKLDGFDLNRKFSNAPPNMEELQELTSGWDGVIALFGFYEERGGTLHRKTGRYTSIAKADDHSVIHNLMGKQYVMTVIDEVAGEKPLARPLKGRRDQHIEREMVQFSNGSQQKNGFIPEGLVALLENVIVFEIRELPKEEGEG